MPAFRCRIAAKDGNILEKTLIADSKASLKKHLEQEGNFIFKIERAGGLRAYLKNIGFRKSFKSKDFLAFNQEFSVLIRAGLPIVTALDAIIEKESESGLNEILKDIRNDVSAGGSLSGAFDKYAHVFSKLYIASLQSGEKSGDIPLAILRYIEYMKKMAEIKQKVVAASVYPIILSAVSIFTVLFLLVYVVPVFTRTFFEAGTQLPKITMALVSFSNMLRLNYIYILFSIGCLVVGLIYLQKSDTGRMYSDRWKLMMPFIGELYRNYAASKISRTLSTVLGGGTPLVISVKISSDVLENQFLKIRLEDLIQQLEQGSGFSEALSKVKIFPVLAVRLIHAGESSGSLEQVLNDVAEFYDNDVDTKLTMLTTAVEPALMIIMGLLIGFIVLAMYMPVFQLAGTVN